jgi:uncharacterized membrane protein YgdD (TMEM256/DUF423 family)
MTRWLIAFAGVAGAVAVGFGAFGAHALRKKLPEDRLANLELGVRYLYFHIPALLAVAWLSSGFPCGGNLFTTIAAWSFVGGMVLFSGSLITLALTGERRWGRVTPVGGVLLLVGWVALIGAGLTVTSAAPAGPFIRSFLQTC